jgi:hypothetical protein
MSESVPVFGAWCDSRDPKGPANGVTVFPPKSVEVVGPLVFLAGPIKGSARWQDEAISYLERNAPVLNIASPRKSLDRAADYSENDYIDQVDWESDYLRRAAKEGVIAFFFAKEETHFCDRPFARTTRIEFGEWMAHHELEGTKLVIGFEQGFDGDKYIRHRLQTMPGIQIGESLEAMLDMVIDAALLGSTSRSA